LCSRRRRRARSGHLQQVTGQVRASAGRGGPRARLGTCRRRRAMLELGCQSSCSCRWASRDLGELELVLLHEEEQQQIRELRTRSRLATRMAATSPARSHHPTPLNSSDRGCEIPISLSIMPNSAGETSCVGEEILGGAVWLLDRNAGGSLTMRRAVGDRGELDGPTSFASPACPALPQVVCGWRGVLACVLLPDVAMAKFV
jgi:hypothetical protein